MHPNRSKAINTIWLVTLLILASMFLRTAQPQEFIVKSELSMEGIRGDAPRNPLLFYRGRPIVNSGESVANVMSKLGPGELVDSGYTTSRHVGFFSERYRFEGTKFEIVFSYLSGDLWGLGAHRVLPSAEARYYLSRSAPNCSCELCQFHW